MQQDRCSIDGCLKALAAKGLCATHYRRLRLYGDANTVKQKQRHGLMLRERFESYIVKTTGCWLWSGAKGHRGYGRIRVDDKSVLAHRLSYELLVGPVDAAIKVLHRCDNPPCVNPDHLFLGTQAENVADMEAKGRRRGWYDSGKDLRGANNGRAKLDAETVEMIRIATGRQRDIAKLFGCSQAQVWNIKHNKQWILA